jgi:hypothetical protein
VSLVDRLMWLAVVAGFGIVIYGGLSLAGTR